MSEIRRVVAALEPLRSTCDEHAPRSDRPRRVRRIGRVRVPLAGPYRPWATLYRLPDGRAVWVIRLWELGRPVPRVVGTAALLAYARRSGLAALADEVEALAARE